MGVVVTCSILAYRVNLKINPNMKMNITEDDFVVFVPKVSLYALILIVFVSGSIVPLAVFFVPKAGNFALALWVVSIVAAAFTIYCVYGVIYYMSFVTYVCGNGIRHKELFYREFTVTFNDVRRAKYGRRMGSEKLILYTDKDIILEAEEHFVGYQSLLNIIERKGGLKIECDSR